MNAIDAVSRWQEIGPKLDENLFLRAVPQATTDDSESMPSITIQVQFISLFLGNHSQLLAEMEKSFPELGLQAEDCTEMNWLESALFMNGMSGQGVEALLDRTPMFNLSFKAKSDFVTKPIAEAEWEKIWRALGDLKAKNNAGLLMIMEPLGGRMSEISESAIPFPHRKGNLYNIQYYIIWAGADEEENQRQLDSMREFYRFMTPYVSSNPRTAYYGYKDIDLGGTYGVFPSYSIAREWGEKYFKGNFERLATVKRSVDPMNFFRNEQSIPPLFCLNSSSFEEQMPLSKS